LRLDQLEVRLTWLMKRQPRHSWNCTWLIDFDILCNAHGGCRVVRRGMSMLRLSDQLLGRFRIDARIAEGGMATVYRGFDQSLDQTIAIKVLRHGAIADVARFEREAEILAALDHPGISRYIARGVAPDGARFLVIEWIDGTTLADHHARVGLTPADGIAVVARVAEALGAAHARGLVHRDIKPDNILLAGGELSRATVIDFGLGHRTAGDLRLTDTGIAVGTPGYMAPEQARGERAVDPRSDVFALGCVLFECVSGTPAFAGRNPAAVMARIVLCEPPAIRTVWPAAPPALEQLLSRMLARRRDDRPRDAAEVAAELRAIIAPDAPRRRRSTSEAAPTAAGPGHRPAAHAIFLHAGAIDPVAAIAASVSAVQPIVAGFGASVHGLADGTIVAVVPGDAAAAADCALAIARSLPGAAIALAGPGQLAAAPLAAALDAGAEALERADLERIFGGAGGAIRIDPITARRLAGQFEIHDDGAGTWRLIGRSP
jgi:tRNA A-37 threonylcarbamoyl transferase component Bud32